MSKESRKLVACIVAALLEEQQSEDVAADIHRSKEIDGARHIDKGRPRG